MGISLMFSIFQGQIDLISFRNFFLELFLILPDFSSMFLCNSDIGCGLTDADEDNQTGTSEPSNGK